MKFYLKCLVLFYLFNINVVADYNIIPYLQSITSNSVHICWQFDSDSISIVRFGTDSLTLSKEVGGDVELITNTILWHTVKLENLLPNTVYYYQCISGDTAKSFIYRFKTYPEKGEDSNIKFVIIGDNRTYPDKFYSVMSAVKEKIIDLYGEDEFYNFNLMSEILFPMDTLLINIQENIFHL